MDQCWAVGGVQICFPQHSSWIFGEPSFEEIVPVLMWCVTVGWCSLPSVVNLKLISTRTQPNPKAPLSEKSAYQLNQHNVGGLDQRQQTVVGITRYRGNIYNICASICICVSSIHMVPLPPPPSLPSHSTPHGPLGQKFLHATVASCDAWCLCWDFQENRAALWLASATGTNLLTVLPAEHQVPGCVPANGNQPLSHRSHPAICHLARPCATTCFGYQLYTCQLQELYTDMESEMGKHLI